MEEGSLITQNGMQAFSSSTWFLYLFIAASFRLISLIMANITKLSKAATSSLTAEELRL